MKRFVLTVCLMAVALAPVYAQSRSNAENAQSQFMLKRAQGASEQEIYDALKQCYNEATAQVSSNPRGSAEWSAAKKVLRETWPYYQNAAAWYSNRGSAAEALSFARIYMDIPLLEAFDGESFNHDANFPTMAYFAASGAFNSRYYKSAVKYFRVYLDTGDPKHRKDVYTFMAKALMTLGDYDAAMKAIDEASNNYPDDYNILSLAINNCIDRQDYDNLQHFVSKAMAIKPEDETLLSIQGKLYEDTHQFQKAIATYSKLDGMKPGNLAINQHLAVNYYNLGVLNYNNAGMERDEAAIKKYTRIYKDYFSAAAERLQDIVATDPGSSKYLTALATAYACIGNDDALDKANARLEAIGRPQVPPRAEPVMISFTDKEIPTSGQAAAPSQKQPATKALDIPLYSAFAKDYVESRVKKWQNKDPYETISEYRQRVTEETRRNKINELLKEAEKEYISTYSRKVRFNDMVLKPYDAENRVFLVESRYGEMIVPVPRENNEAKSFESSWSGMQFKNPSFYISNDKLLVSALTFVTPSGKSYRFDGDTCRNYTETVVDLSFEPVGDVWAGASGGSGGVKRNTVTIPAGSSDVDMNIPLSGKVNRNTFAVIISNENYNLVAGVPMALNDGNTFRKYCTDLLGLPETNVRFYPDASYGVMLRAVRDIKDIADAYSGDLQVIFYYAGHGIPDEKTGDAFLLPVDADGQQTEGCYPLSRLYSELGALGANSVVVFLDACFSGATREGGMLASARGIAKVVKKEAPKGKMVVFTAASGDETALPYKEKGHGLFTYYLLKKLQESKGNVSMDDLTGYVTDNVKRQSVVINRKSQTPAVNVSAAIGDGWKDIKLIP